MVNIAGYATLMFDFGGDIAFAYDPANLLDDGDMEAADTSAWTAGPLGMLAKFVPGTSATNLQATIKSIVANIGFDKLQDMRLQSPTGGALGQVAVQELESLQASIANLEQSQSPSQLKENLGVVMKHYERFLKLAKENRGKLQSLGVDNFWSEAASATYTSTSPAYPETDDEYNNLPSGSYFIDPDDKKLYIKE